MACNIVRFYVGGDCNNLDDCTKKNSKRVWTLNLKFDLSPPVNAKEILSHRWCTMLQIQEPCAISNSAKQQKCK